MSDSGDQPKKKMGRPATGKQPIRKLRISDARFQVMRDAAAAQGKSFSQWARDGLYRLARRELARIRRENAQDAS